jgi:hypothetical protein
MVLDPLGDSDGVNDRRFSVLRRLISLGFRRLRPDLRCGLRRGSSFGEDRQCPLFQPLADGEKCTAGDNGLFLGGTEDDFLGVFHTSRRVMHAGLCIREGMPFSLAQEQFWSDRTEPAITRHVLYLLARKGVTPALSGGPGSGNREGKYAYNRRI